MQTISQNTRKLIHHEKFNIPVLWYLLCSYIWLSLILMSMCIARAGTYLLRSSKGSIKLSCQWTRPATPGEIIPLKLNVSFVLLLRKWSIPTASDTRWNSCRYDGDRAKCHSHFLQMHGISPFPLHDRCRIGQISFSTSCGKIQVFVQWEFVKFQLIVTLFATPQLSKQCSPTYSRIHFWLCHSSCSSNNVRRPTGQAPHGVLVAVPPTTPGGAVLLCLLRPRTGRGKGHLLGRDWGEDITVFSRVSTHGRLKLTGQKTGGRCLHRQAICMYIREP